MQQTHRSVNKIVTSVEVRTLCAAVFLDVAQSFDEIWHTGLLYKIKIIITCLESRRVTAMETLEQTVARHSVGKHVQQYRLFSVWSSRGLCKGVRVEAGSNTSTVTLRVVGSDEKGSPKCDTVKHDHESQETRTREKLRWQGPAPYTKKQTRPLVREGAP
jgi:hypothetical protein